MSLENVNFKKPAPEEEKLFGFSKEELDDIYSKGENDQLYGQK